MTPRLFALVLLLLSTITAAPQTAVPITGRNFTQLIPLSPAGQQAQTTATATLHGTVVNSVTHQPIARALVTLEPSGQAMLTDSDGHFSFDSVPGGMVMVSARRPGFGGADANTDRQFARINVTGTNTEVTVQLTPLSAITGELIFPGDDLPDSLQVQLLRRQIENGRAHWTQDRTSETTSDGHFRFGNLPEGAYLVHVGASLDPAPARPPGGAVQIRYGYVPAFYPGARDLAAAGVITLSPGQQQAVRMELTREPFYPVAIPVANPDQARSVGFEITSSSFLGINANYTPTDGSVHVHLPAGHFLLQAQSFGQRGLTGQREFDVYAGVRALPIRTAAITLVPTNRIPVTVHTEFTQASSGGGVSGFSQIASLPSSGTPTAASQMNLTLEPADGGLTQGRNPSLQDDETSQTTGASYLIGVDPGKYWINANAYTGYIASITSGGTDLFHEPLTVNPDGSAAPIEVTLRDDTGTLTAALAPNLVSSYQQVFLQLIPQSAPAGDHSGVIAFGSAITLPNLPPGSYLAIASTSRSPIEYRNPAALTALTGKDQSVTISPNGSEHITIDSLADLSPSTPGGSL